MFDVNKMGEQIAHLRMENKYTQEQLAEKLKFPLRQSKLAGNYNIEAYFAPTHNDPKDDYCEIWIPVEKI